MFKYLILFSFISICLSTKLIPTIPGADRLQSGVDISLFDLSSINVYYRPVIELTYEKGKTWTNPYNDVTYSLPDQLTEPQRIPDTLIDAKSSTSKSSSEVIEKMKESISAGITFPKFSFSVSYTYQSESDTLYSQEKTIGEVIGFFSAYKIYTALFGLIPTDELKMSIDFLPDNYTKDPNMWEDFFGNNGFGTHYLDYAIFGGRYYFYNEIKNTLWKQMTDEQVKVNIAASFWNRLKVDGEHSGENKHVDENYLESTTTSVQYFGGNSGSMGAGGWDKWAPTIGGNPWIIGLSLTPLSKLFSYNKTIQYKLDNALLYHLRLAGAKNLTKNLNYYQQELKSIINRANILLNNYNNCPKEELGYQCGTCMKISFFGICINSCCKQNNIPTQLNSIISNANNMYGKMTQLINLISIYIEKLVISDTQINEWELALTSFNNLYINKISLCYEYVTGVHSSNCCDNKGHCDKGNCCCGPSNYICDEFPGSLL